jgi:hypothetical protein
MKRIILVIFLLLATPAFAQDDSNTVIGTEATFIWTPATGPVVNYVVQILRNNTPPWKSEQIVDINSATITGVDGERIEVQVAALDDMNNQGPMSPRSEKVYFSVIVDPDPTPTPTPTPIPLGMPGQPILGILINNEN